MKKLMSLCIVLAFSTSLLTSCGGKKDSSTASDDSAVSNISDISGSSLDENGVSDDAAGGASDDASELSESTSVDASEDNISTDEPAKAPEKMEDTEVYKAVSAIDFSKGVTFTMVVDFDVYTVTTNTYYKDGASCQEVISSKDGETVTEKIISQNGYMYILDSGTKTYTVTETDVDETHILRSVEEFFVDYAYHSTSTEVIDGVEYTVDTFGMKEGEGEIKFYTEKGEVAKMHMMGKLVEVKLFSGVPDGIFDIPEGYTEKTK